MNYQKSKEEFVQDCQSLLDRIEQNIENLSQNIRSKMKEASNEMKEELNELKLHRKKVQDVWAEAKASSEENWNRFKVEMINTFDKAEKRIQKVNPSLSSTGLEDLPTSTYKESLATHTAVKA